MLHGRTSTQLRGVMQPAMDRSTVVVGMADEPDCLIDEIARRPAARVVLEALQAKPVRTTDSWQHVPELAEEIPSVANGGLLALPDGSLDVIWRLRAGFRWHDGAPVTCDDVRWSYLLMKQSPALGFFPTALPHVQRLFLLEPKVADANSIVVQWAARPPVASAIWCSILPAHHFPWNSRIAVEELRHLEFARRPVYAGPFRFSAWVPGVELALAVNEEYPAGVPALDRLLFRFYPTPEALMEAVVSGEVDIAEMTGFTLQQAEAIERAVPEVLVHRTPTLMAEHLTFRLDSPHMHDRRVRHAVAHAIDRTALCRVAGGGIAPALSWLPPQHPAHHAVLAPYRYDPARATALLDEAGWGADSAGRRRGPDGAGARLTIAVEVNGQAGPLDRWLASSDRLAMADCIQHALAAIGIETAVTCVTRPAMAEQLATQQPDLVLHGASVQPEQGQTCWHSSAVPGADNEWRGVNFAGWRHDANDRCLELIASTLDSFSRQQLLHTQQHLWATELPALPLLFRHWVTTAKCGLRGIRPVGLPESFLTWNAAQWAWDDTLR